MGIYWLIGFAHIGYYRTPPYILKYLEGIRND